jgi:hypothetical protein
MAEIYDLPEGFEAPELDFMEPIQKYNEKCDKFFEELKTFLKNWNPHEKEVGEIVDWPVADGKAMYMVASLEPKVGLVHLPILDAWEYQDADLQTAERIRQKIQQRKSFEAFIAKKQKEKGNK